MPTFQYVATTTAGTIHTGTQDAPDNQSLISMLRAKGLFPTKIKDITKAAPAYNPFVSKVKIASLSMFCIQMSSVLQAGVPLSTALEIMRTQVDDKALRKILDDVSAKLQIGHSLSEAFTPYKDRFPPLFMNMLEAGELSGSLDTCLRRAGETFTKQQKINSKVKSAMAYPIVLLVLTVAIAAFLIGAVVPMFASQYENAGADLPTITKMLLGMSDFLLAYWLPLIIVVGMVVFSFNLWLSTDMGRTAFDTFKLKIPVVGKLLTVVAAGRYSRTLSTMNAAGVPLSNALEVTAHSVGNRYMEKKINIVLEEVRMGSSLSAPLERLKIFPPLITHMTRLGEESGTLDHLLEQTAEFYEEQSESAIAQLTALMEPLIIIVMGVVVLFVVLGIITPMNQATMLAGG